MSLSEPLEKLPLIRESGVHKTELLDKEKSHGFITETTKIDLPLKLKCSHCLQQLNLGQNYMHFLSCSHRFHICCMGKYKCRISRKQCLICAH